MKFTLNLSDFEVVEDVRLKERAWKGCTAMSGETDLLNCEMWGFVLQVVAVKGEASGRERRGANAKEDENFNAKEEVELNAMEEGKLPVRWSWLGEVEEEEKFRWNFKSSDSFGAF